MSGRRPEPELRRRAEARLAELQRHGEQVGAPEARQLLSELQVHQIELELQNEELMASRAALEHALGQYTELFDFAPIGYFEIAHDGKITRTNFAGARLLEATRTAVEGRTLAHFVVERDRPAFEGLLASVLTRPEGDAVSEAGEVVLLVGGQERVVRVTGALLGGGARPSALLALEDVTARQRAERALREEARRKDEFLAALSHELRNPLAPIRNALALLELLPPGSEKARSALAVADRQVGHLTRIVDDLLDVTRIAHGKIRIQSERLDLGELVARTVADHRPAFDQRCVLLGCDADPGVWVEADGSRLVQVLGNLLGNALKFTSPGDRVEVQLTAEADAAVLRVRDNGAGITADLRDKLFLPFSQGPQTLDRSRGGLGLGLATVKGLVEQHGGSVQVASDGPGRGSEFVVRLPRCPPPAPAEDASRIAPPSPGARRVLVIEDNADAADTLRELLEHLGYEVRVEREGAGGIQAAPAFRPDVVLCDLGLPGVSGYEVARALRAGRGRASPYLVALSGYAWPDEVARAEQAGFDCHLAKPATPERLARALAQAAAR